MECDLLRRRRRVLLRRCATYLAAPRLPAGPQQRLAACDTHLAHAELGGKPAQAFDLVEAQPLVVSQEAEVLAIGRLRHAVRTAEVAAIHHRYAQIVQRTPVPVAWLCRSIERFEDGVKVSHRGEIMGANRCFDNW